MTATYRNPWNVAGYGPALFSCEKRPRNYRGHLIYHPHRGRFDVVRDGVCRTQRAGFNGAKRYVDEVTA